MQPTANIAITIASSYRMCAALMGASAFVVCYPHIISASCHCLNLTVVNIREYLWVSCSCDCDSCLCSLTCYWHCVSTWLKNSSSREDFRQPVVTLLITQSCAVHAVLSGGSSKASLWKLVSAVYVCTLLGISWALQCWVLKVEACFGACVRIHISAS